MDSHGTSSDNIVFHLPTIHAELSGDSNFGHFFLGDNSEVLVKYGKKLHEDICLDVVSRDNDMGSILTEDFKLDYSSLFVKGITQFTSIPSYTHLSSSKLMEITQAGSFPPGNVCLLSYRKWLILSFLWYYNLFLFFFVMFFV